MKDEESNLLDALRDLMGIEPSEETEDESEESFIQRLEQAERMVNGLEE